MSNRLFCSDVDLFGEVSLVKLDLKQKQGKYLSTMQARRILNVMRVYPNGSSDGLLDIFLYYPGSLTIRSSFQVFVWF